MSKPRVHSFSISIDGLGAGPNQDLENPLGVGGFKVFDWFFPTRTWQRMHGNEDGETGVDDDVAAQGFAGIGAYVLGRNMFGRTRVPLVPAVIRTIRDLFSQVALSLFHCRKRVPFGGVRLQPTPCLIEV